MAITVESLQVGVAVVGAAAAQRALAMVGAAFNDAVKAARDSAETFDKFNTVFSKTSVMSKRAADSIAKSFGITGTASRKMLGDVGDILTGFGFTQEAALDLADEVTRLGLDLASFTNFSGGAEGATAALTKAMLGEAESVKALGIVIRQDTAEYKAMIEQIMKAENVSLTQAKALAALEIATIQSKNAVGDYARTMDSAANVHKRYESSLDDLSITVGTIANETLTPFKTLLTGIIEETTEATKSSDDLMLASQSLGAALAFMSDAERLGKAIEGLGLFSDIVMATINPTWALVKAVRSLFTSAEEEDFSAMQAWGEGYAQALENAVETEEELEVILGQRKDDIKSLLALELDAQAAKRASRKANYEAEVSEIEAVAELEETTIQQRISGYQALGSAITGFLSTAFGDSKAAASVMALINTALAVTNALANIIPPFNFIAAAAVSAAGVAQIATINGASFADGTPPGGYTVPSGYNDDSFPVSAKSGETVNISRAGESGGGTQIVIMLDSQVLADVTTDLIANRKIVIRQGDLLAS